MRQIIPIIPGHIYDLEKLDMREHPSVVRGTLLQRVTRKLAEIPFRYSSIAERESHASFRLRALSHALASRQKSVVSKTAVEGTHNSVRLLPVTRAVEKNSRVDLPNF